MTPRERVQAALNHTSRDFTPCDYYATPELQEELARHFGLPNRRRRRHAGRQRGGLEDGGVSQRLGTDSATSIRPTSGRRCRVRRWLVDEPLGGPPPPMANEYGEYAEPVGHSLRRLGPRSKRLRSFPGRVPIGSTTMPSPRCARVSRQPLPPAAPTCRTSSTAWPSAAASNKCCWTSPLTIRFTCTSSRRRHRFYLAYIERILAAARGRIDLVHCGDDFGSQRGLLISPASFDRLFAAKKKSSST